METDAVAAVCHTVHIAWSAPVSATPPTPTTQNEDFEMVSDVEIIGVL